MNWLDQHPETTAFFLSCAALLGGLWYTAHHGPDRRDQREQLVPADSVGFAPHDQVRAETAFEHRAEGVLERRMAVVRGFAAALDEGSWESDGDVSGFGDESEDEDGEEFYSAEERLEMSWEYVGGG